MFGLIDMGTSNTRVWIYENDRFIGEKKAPFGAKLGKLEGRASLWKRLHDVLAELGKELSLPSGQPEVLIASGMAGSEIGIWEIPHRSLPADLSTLADGLVVKKIEEISDAPILFVSGLKQCANGSPSDLIRGEETEIMGILSSLPKGEAAVIVLPGTHCKIISVNEQGVITRFRTTLSGELLDLIVSGSILAGQVFHNKVCSELALRQGMAYAKENGMNSALFHVRVMAKNGYTEEELSSFLYGAVMGEDVELILREAKGRKIYVGGRESLRLSYCTLLGDRSIPLSDDIAEGAVRQGLLEVYRLYQAKSRRPDVMKAIEEEKLIAILRAPDKNTLTSAMDALYEGGIRLAELTFDRSGQISKEETCRQIEYLAKFYQGKLWIGAGTVTSEEEVWMAYHAGAAFIISPNCDPSIIALTKKLGLVSIPAAFTPTEIALATDCGADYIKLFPADQLGANYVKAISAPLSDAKLLAVGGVNAENAKEFLSRGFYGVGVGSNLYDKKLIQNGDFTALKERAKQYVQALK